MSWTNLGGMNPKFKDFMDKHPDKTVIGVGWAFYWRFFVVVFALEIIFFAIIFILAAIFGGFNH